MKATASRFLNISRLFSLNACPQHHNSTAGGSYLDDAIIFLAAPRNLCFIRRPLWLRAGFAEKWHRKQISQKPGMAAADEVGDKNGDCSTWSGLRGTPLGDMSSILSALVPTGVGGKSLGVEYRDRVNPATALSRELKCCGDPRSDSDGGGAIEASDDSMDGASDAIERALVFSIGSQ